MQKKPETQPRMAEAESDAHMASDAAIAKREDEAIHHDPKGEFIVDPSDVVSFMNANVCKSD